MGCSQIIPKERQGKYWEKAVQRVDLTTNDYTYKLTLNEKDFELEISHSVSTRKPDGSGGLISISAMSLLQGEVEFQGDESKNEEIFIIFKTKQASSQTGGGSFGVPLPDPSSIVDFKMKFNPDDSISFVTYPKMKFSQLTGTLRKPNK